VNRSPWLPSPAPSQLITGGIPDSNWPPYASNVVLELWKPAVSDEEAEEEAVVRVLYNGVPTRVKGCGGAAMRDLFKPRVADTDSPDPALWCPFSQWKVRTLAAVWLVAVLVVCTHASPRCTSIQARLACCPGMIMSGSARLSLLHRVTLSSARICPIRRLSSESTTRAR
jgi:hypothetical protein